MASNLRKIYYWPDAVYCDDCDLDAYLQFKSDDFGVVQVPDTATDDQIDAIVLALM
jgi:hypothetical protein